MSGPPAQGQERKKWGEKGILWFFWLTEVLRLGE